jgi:serine/threonine protein kinase
VDPLIGTVVLDSYVLKRMLGSGGMAVVYLGENQLTGQAVAVKMLPPELAAYEEIKVRFLQEARTLAKLEHPAIVHLINFAEDSGRLCLIMQYAEGETFEDMIERHGRIAPKEAVSVSVGVLEGLAHAHKNQIVHRDIKPSNIIVRKDGSVKVTDFGIAKIMLDNKMTQTGQTMGTVRYMAPEQVRGKGVDERTDLYAMGISLYEAVLGAPPFDAESHFEVMQMHLTTEPAPPRRAGAPISAELEAVILKAIAKPPEDRYQTADQFREALLATPEGQGSDVLGPPQAVGLAPTRLAASLDSEGAARPRRWRLLLMLGVLVAIGAAVTLTLHWRSESGRGKERTSVSTDDGVVDARPRKSPPRLPASHPVLALLQKRLGAWPLSELHAQAPPLFVISDVASDGSRIASGYRSAQAEYRRLLSDQGIGYPLEIRPLTLVVISDALLNDEELWADVPGKVKGPDFYLPAQDESLLFVARDKPYSKRQARYSVALHFCPLKVANERCLELARLFEKNERVEILP